MSKSPHSPNINLFVLGDSISMHYGPYLAEFVDAKFHYDRKKRSDDAGSDDDLDIATSIYGDNGGDSSMALEYLLWRNEINPIPSGLLLLNCGLHDIKRDPGSGRRQIAPGKYIGNLRLILEAAKAMNLRVIWARITPVIDEIHNRRITDFQRLSADVAEYNSLADEIMNEAGVPMIDLHDFTHHFLPSGFSDHVHYTPEVSKLQAAFLAGHLIGYSE